MYVNRFDIISYLLRGLIRRHAVAVTVLVAIWTMCWDNLFTHLREKKNLFDIIKTFILFRPDDIICLLYAYYVCVRVFVCVCLYAVCIFNDNQDNLVIY